MDDREKLIVCDCQLLATEDDLKNGKFLCLIKAINVGEPLNTEPNINLKKKVTLLSGRQEVIQKSIYVHSEEMKRFLSNAKIWIMLGKTTSMKQGNLPTKLVKK